MQDKYLFELMNDVQDLNLKVYNQCSFSSELNNKNSFFANLFLFDK
jgi:hypothetical protein